MEQMIKLFNILLPVLYVACMLMYLYCFVNQDQTARKLARVTLWISLTFHLLFLLIVGIHYQRPPMGNFFEALSFLAFTVGFVYAYIERRVKEESAGLFILVFVFLFQLFSSTYVSHTENVSEILSTRSMAFHIGMSLFSFSALAISAIFSVMYLMLYNNIKNHRFGLIYSRLPSLERLGNLCYHGAFVGFALLTIGIISGIIQFAYLTRAWDQYVKVLFVLITWGVYGTLVFLKIFRGWQGPRIALFSLIGFTTTILSLVVAYHLFG